MAADKYGRQCMFYAAEMITSYQSLAVQQSCPAVAGRRPLSEADHMIQLPRQAVHVVLLFLQSLLVVLSQRLRGEQRSQDVGEGFYEGNAAQRKQKRTSSWFIRIFPFLLISIIRLQMDFFISFVTAFRFSSTCCSLWKLRRRKSW